MIAKMHFYSSRKRRRVFDLINLLLPLVGCIFCVNVFVYCENAKPAIAFAHQRN
jgi:hypothetical protein